MVKIGKTFTMLQLGKKLWNKIQTKAIIKCNIDKERYTSMPGLEGPFQTMSGVRLL